MVKSNPHLFRNIIIIIVVLNVHMYKSKLNKTETLS